MYKNCFVLCRCWDFFYCLLFLFFKTLKLSCFQLFLTLPIILPTSCFHFPPHLSSYFPFQFSSMCSNNVKYIDSYAITFIYDICIWSINLLCNEQNILYLLIILYLDCHVYILHKYFFLYMKINVNNCVTKNNIKQKINILFF